MPLIYVPLIMYASLMGFFTHPFFGGPLTADADDATKSHAADRD